MSNMWTMTSKGLVFQILWAGEVAQQEKVLVTKPEAYTDNQ